MQSAYLETNTGRGLPRLYPGVFCALLLAIVVVAGAPSAKAESVRTYDSPQNAVKALIDAAKANDKDELLKILGPEAKSLVFSGDETADNAERARFVKAYEVRHGLVSYIADEQSGKPARLFLEVGKDAWPFPIPIAADQTGKRWSFDGKAGVDELLSRRIGYNELATIEVCRAYVDAQYEYYRLNPEKSAVPHFARKIASSPGKRDGLYWETKPGEAESPLGALVAEAADDGYTPVQQGEDRSYYGYRYRVLTGQGEHGAQGAFSYIGNDLMFGGFALLAYPENYGVSGVMTFIVNQDGVVYEKNLGKDTGKLATKIADFDPDPTWNKIDEP